MVPAVSPHGRRLPDVAGRIRDEDIALVRERSPIADVVSEHVTLRNAGGGSLKGLCPFHDEKTPSFNVTPSRGFFHCLAADTRVLTWEGARPIRELAGGVHRVLGRDANWVEAPFFCFGVQPLMRLTVSRNGQTKVIHATDEHRWFVKSGRTGQSMREVFTRELKPGHRLISKFPRTRVKRTTPSPFGIAHGITFGDGTRSGSGSMAQLDPVKDAQLLKWFPHSLVTEHHDQWLVHHLPRFFKELPALDESVSYLYGWLAGYVAADGHVAKDGTVSLNSAHREELEHVRAICTRLGIGTYGITEQVRQGFPGREPSSLFRIHFVNDDLTDEFFLNDEHRLRFTGSRKAYARQGWVVRNVEWSDRVEEVFCAVVEDGHAFTLEDNILTGNCFGCAEGGDVIDFVMKIDHLPFAEAIERLANRAGVQLRYEEGGYTPRRDQGQRARLVQAHRAAAQFYAEQLASSPEAGTGRRFLDERGFDHDAAARFGVGYAPKGWDVLTTHLRGRGFSNEELVTGGLARQGQRGLIDRFMGRLVWPLRDITGDVVGFGARRLYDDDRIEAKYLNTPESPIYKKSQVLYGIDLAKKEIARRNQAVVVEGYTDVMACHLAGVPTAVATCGTAFGAEHAKVLRRLLMDQEGFRGELVFTFDGDEAGQKAARRAFEEHDQRLVRQTFVAVEPEGLDPCELRQKKGDAAVRDLVARRLPLFEFAIRSELGRYDLETSEGRVGGLHAAAPVVVRIRDRALHQEYGRRLAGWLGMEVEDVMGRLRALARGVTDVAETAGPVRPDPRDPALLVEREALKIALQHPQLAGPLYDGLERGVFTAEPYAAVHAAILAAGGTAGATAGAPWVSSVRDQVVDDHVRALVAELAVEGLHTPGEPDRRYAAEHLAALQAGAVTRRVNELKSRLQRVNPVEQPDGYNRLFGELVALEQYRRGLRERAIDGI